MSSPSKKQSVHEVIRFLKRSKDNYLSHYFRGGTMYDDEGNDCGGFTQKTLDKLLDKRIIKKVGLSTEFWSDGYYQLI